MPRRLRRRRFLAQGAATTAALLTARAGARLAAPYVQESRPVAGDLRYQLVASSPAEVEVAQDFIDATFRRQFPDVRVTVEPAPDRRDERLLAAMAAGDAPDVFDTWRDDVVKYAAQDQVLDVEPLVARDLTAAEVADFFPSVWADFVLPGGLRFGLPKYVNLMVVWFNKDLFDAADLAYPDDEWDHDVYAEAARRLTRLEGSTTATWGLYYPAFALDRFWYKLEAWGGRLVDPADPTRAAFGSAEALAAAEWARALTFDDGANARRNILFPEGGGAVATIEAFAAGKLAMVEAGFFPFAIARGVGDRFRWGFAAVPAGPAGRRVLGTADGFAVWAGTNAPDAAWELVRFLSGPRYQLELTVLTGYLPNRFSILQQWKQLCTRFYPALGEANLDVATQAMDAGYAGNRPLFAKDAEAQALIAPALERVFVAGDAPVSHLAEVAEQVTERMRAA